LERARNPYFNRELSWLSFNHRVLQEVENEENPLFERIKFLAIYSSNLDEFFRVRVALYQQVVRLEKKEGIKGEASRVLKRIKKEVIKQQDLFGKIISEGIFPGLYSENIRLVSHHQLSTRQKVFLIENFKSGILKLSKPIEIGSTKPFLENRELYFFIRTTMLKTPRIEHYYYVLIPSTALGRFIELPNLRKRRAIILLDEVVKFFFKDIFKGERVRLSYEIKMSRDAKLYLEDEEGSSMLQKIKKSLPKRITGKPSRLLYDGGISKAHLKVLRKNLGLTRGELIPGGTVHNFHDLFGFPIGDGNHLTYPRQIPLKHRQLAGEEPIFKLIKSQDQLLHFPYQSYDPVVDFIHEAAGDTDVKSINITLYRVAKNSKICTALVLAARNGKEVLVFNEVKARFDEESNIYWGKELEKAGARVLYSFEKLKVHSKICLVKRKEGKRWVNYSYLGTGNFNEETSSIYCDHGLFTVDTGIARELDQVFSFLQSPDQKPKFRNLLVAPFNLRSGLMELIDFEIREALAGREAKMVLKMNSLEDRKMIDKLYEASRAGVKIKLIVRGICCLIPTVPGQSDNIKVISIVDRFLEHARVYLFFHGGGNKLFLASADLMKRNLSNRVEVGFPINDPSLKAEMLTYLNFQLADNTRARFINKTQSNPFKSSKSKKKSRVQFDFYDYLRKGNEL
jgi:polyphosphate kinase